jgi:hypothetical protein
MVFCKTQEHCVFCAPLLIEVRNNRSELFNLISVSKSISKPKFIYFLENFVIFWSEEKMTWSENSDSSKNDDFPLIQKNSKWIQKKYRKFDLLIDFDIEIDWAIRIDYFWLIIDNRAQRTQCLCALHNTIA